MKVELHCHTTSYSGCATASPQQVLERLIACRYEAVYFTEHDAVWPVEAMADLQRQFPAIRILPGVELSVGDDATQHLLVLGTDDPLYLAMRADPAAVIYRARNQGHLTVLAHPYRWPGGAELLVSGPLPDAIELSTPNHEPRAAHQALEASVNLSLPVVNSGDVHALSMINQFWITTAQPIRQADDIRRIVLEGRFRNCAAAGQ